MFERILFPTDGSPTADEAWSQALELAERFSGTLDIVLVIDQHYIFLSDSMGVYDEWEEVERAVREKVTEELEALVEEATERGVEAEYHILEGVNPAEVILDHADEQGSDAIVMGTHGRSGVKRWLLGSVAERVSRHAGRPVVLVPPEDA